MKYFIYRMDYNYYIKRNNFKIIPNQLNDFLIEDKSKIIIIISKSLIVIGAYYYDKDQNAFILEKEINKTIIDFYEKLPMINFVNKRTYKLFSKKIREIDEENYNIFLEKEI